MSEPEATPEDWSALGTVKEFDNGLNSTDRDIVTTANKSKRDIVTATSDITANSLFIESIVDQVCKLLEKDPLRQRKIYDVICAKLFELHLIDETYRVEELASLRAHYQQALVSLITAPDPRSYKMSPLKLEWSRYHTEYEEVCLIAAGGFGKVFKAKHLLDQVFYAVKKIVFKSEDLSKFLIKLGEVKTLAKLNHPNIVQYKAAWLEPLFKTASAPPSPDITTINGSDSDGIVFQNSSSDTSSEAVSLDNVKESNMAVCSFKSIKNRHRSSISRIGVLLYVSMQLCDETLKCWLDRRRAINEPINIALAISIIMQATTGIQYIHSCNIVHHDIKPSNIFLSSDLKSVQVGDFGLACCLQGHNHSDCPLEGGQIGTPLYAAPEQLRGRCNPKSDMFSLGLVLIELVTIFSTEMERIDILTKVRSGYLPPSIPFDLVPIVKDLTAAKPDLRPTASQLITRLERLIAKPSVSPEKPRLVSLSEDSDDSAISQNEFDVSLMQLKDEVIKDKDREINELKEMLARKDDEIAQLKKFIRQSSS